MVVCAKGFLRKLFRCLKANLYTGFDDKISIKRGISGAVNVYNIGWATQLVRNRLWRSFYRSEKITQIISDRACFFLTERIFKQKACFTNQRAAYLEFLLTQGLKDRKSPVTATQIFTISLNGSQCQIIGPPFNFS